MEAKAGPGSSYDRILQAAKHLFATRGYENTSTIMIARAASTSESQLVKHFGSKDGLLEAIFERGWESMADLFAVVDGCESPSDKLRCLIDQTLAGLERDPELKELMMLESRRMRKQGSTVLITRGLIAFTQRIEKVLLEMRDCGQLRPGLQPEAVRSAIMGMCEGLMRDQLVARRLGSQPGYTSEQMHAVIDTVLSVFMVTPQVRKAAP